MSKLTINHVMSNNVESKIFNDIMGYFNDFASETFSYITSEKPMNGALVRHYHRPNLETFLINPCIVTVHHDLAENDDWLNFSHFEQHYRQADLVVCLNSEQQNFLSGVGINHTVVIPHGYNKRFLYPKQKRTDDEKIVIGFFSKRYPRKVKGEAYLYELIKYLNPEYFKFVLVGQDRNFDARFMQKFGFEVIVHNTLPYPVFCNLYQSINVLLITSYFEGGPASIPEAIRTGTPIVCSNVGMCMDYVTEGENGFFLDLEPEQDAKKLLALYQDRILLKKISDGAYLKSDKALTWESIVKLYEAQYAKIFNTLVG